MPDISPGHEWIRQYRAGKFLALLVMLLSCLIHAQGFEVPITVSDGVVTVDRILGIDPGGSDDFDTGLDSLAAPAPPAGNFDARLTVNNREYVVDIRDDSMAEKVFRLSYAASASGGPIVLRWDASVLGALGSFMLTDDITGTVDSLDMTTVDSLVAGDNPFLADGVRIRVTPGPTAIHSPNETLPDLGGKSFLLNRNYPNPFNGSTRINFSLAKPAFLTLKIYNQIGQLVTTLAAEQFPAGTHELDWDGTNSNGIAVTSGIYYTILSDGLLNESLKILYAK